MSRSTEAAVCFRDVRIEAELDARRTEGTSRGMEAQRQLDRYLHLLRGQLATLELTESEALAICDALNGTLLEPHTLRLVWAEVDDAMRNDGLANKWGIDLFGLSAKLQSLSEPQCFALGDAVERAWNTPSGPTPETVRAVGLVR